MLTKQLFLELHAIASIFVQGEPFALPVCPANQYCMLVEEIIGKTITNIFQLVEYEHYGIDKGECFIELDHTVIIDIPYGWFNGHDEVWIKKLDAAAVSVLANLSDHAFYRIDKEGKPVKKMATKYVEREPSFFERVKQFLSGQKAPKHTAVEYETYDIDYVENTLKHVKDRKVKDLIAFAEEHDKYFLELDNGYYITETNVGMNGTGRVGINVYKDLAYLINWKGPIVKRISDLLAPPTPIVWTHF